MDRLERLGVSFYTAPGLVPGILGALMVLCGLVLACVRCARRARLEAEAAAPPRTARRLRASASHWSSHRLRDRSRRPRPAVSGRRRDLSVPADRGRQYPERKAKGEVGRGLAVAALVAVGAAIVISTLFEYVFLVRLP
jgi:hypothetical protein